MSKKLAYLLLVGIFIISFVLMIFSAKKDSTTTDESVHLFAGLTYLKERDFRLDPEHPPLLKEIGAIPLFFLPNLNYRLDENWDQAGNFYNDSWKSARTLGEDFLFNWGNDTTKVIFWGRFSFIILTMFLGLVVFLWAKKLYGLKAGIFATFLTLFFPNFLAHGRLVNTDIGLTLFILLTIYFWGSYLKQTIAKNLLLAGLFLGASLASKYTAIIIFPIIIVLLIIKVLLDEKKYLWLRYFLGVVCMIVISYFVVWGSYLFSMAVPPKPETTLSAAIAVWVGSAQVPTSFDHLFSVFRPILWPNYFFKGLVLVSRHALSGHGSFLLGMNSNTGWWYYFPVAILVKTPLPIFAFLGLSVAYFKKLKAKLVFDEYLLIIPFLVFLLFSMFSKANLGLRHVLPVFPFLFIFISRSVNLISIQKIKPVFLTILFGLLTLWYLLSAIFNYPNFLSYFNELAGGPKGGHKILTDSNLDWGQDIYRIKDFLSERKIDQVYMVYPWDGDNALINEGINFIGLEPQDQDVKGYVVISATYYETQAYSWLKKYPYEYISPSVFFIKI